MSDINYSIIIPHKNTPELLVRCIRSIPRRDDIQIIVVDDNSDGADSYQVVYPELSSLYLELYLTKEGRGAGYARNVGLSKAKGRWILFADSDDYFLPEWLCVTDNYLECGADVIQFRIADNNGDSDTNWHNKSLDSYARKEASERDVLFANITCWAKMINTDFLRKNNIVFEEIPYSNDVGFGIKVAVNASKIIVAQSAIYDLTYREGSLTTIKDRHCYWIRYNAQKRANLYAAKHGFKRFELPFAIEMLKSWRALGLKDYLHFVWSERKEFKKSIKSKFQGKPFNYRHPYLYILLVLFKVIR